uniref:MYND-type domain-containing protein n=1 Tax=Mycena chlorophos TaxID=658473 RepID=A0ABQ0M6H0_MYCCL|nr:predicted protein [Mycena chlorophos]
MHETLRMSNVNLLGLQSPILRDIALAAVQGDLDAIEELFEIVAHDESNWSDAKLLAIAPVFYAILDPAPLTRLRGAEVLDADDSVVQCVAYAFRCLEDILYQDILPAEAFVEMWARVWAWVQFLDEYHGYFAFPELVRAEGMQPADQVFSIAMHLFNSVWKRARLEPNVSALRNLVSDASTPGILGVVGRVWVRLLGAKDDLGLYHISMIILMEQFGLQPDSRRLTELMVGTGGTWEHLAACAMGHIRRATVGKKESNPVSMDDCQMIYAVVSLSWNGNKIAPFRSAMYRAKIVTALTLALAALLHSPRENLGALYEVLPPEVFRAITTTFQDPAQFRKSMERALRAGLLELMFEYAETGINRAQEDLRHLLVDFLRRGTLYRSVLLRLRPALAAIQKIDCAAKLPSPELVDHWRGFSAMAQSRLEILDEFEAGRLVAKRSCDNVVCNRILEKEQFRRCSGCLAAYYCSRRCQKADWRTGDHRRECSRWGVQRIHGLDDGNSRDWIFIRALLNHRYLAQRETIAMRYLKLLHNARGPRPSFPPDAWPLPSITFNFTQVPGVIKIFLELPISAAKAQLRGFPQKVARVRESAGRLRMHLLEMFCTDCDNPSKELWSCMRFMPLRCENARFEEGIREILESIPPRVGHGQAELDVEEYRPTVKALLAQLGVETH